MVEKIISKASGEVRALKIVLITFLLLYGAVFIGASMFVATTFPAFLHFETSRSFFWTEIRIILDRILAGLIYFFIGYCIFKLIILASHGEPFSRQSPRYLRRIAYSVFGLGIIGAITSVISVLQHYVFVIDGISQILFKSLGTGLLGFGFLVIAKIIEIGVQLQQDQNLTV